jgi:hypothetical protein
MKIKLMLVTAISVLALLAAGCVVPGTPDSSSAPQPPAVSPPTEPSPAETPQPAPALSTGTIAFSVTDAPAKYEVKSIMVKVAEPDGVQVHRAATEQTEQQGTGNQTQQQEGDGEWITLPITGENPFDLKKLEDENLLLATINVTTGKYTQIRMNIDWVEVTFVKDEVEITENATLPSGKLKFVRPFDVVSGNTTEILVDFDAEKSVNFTGSGKVIVKPVVKLMISDRSGPDESEELEILTEELDNGLLGTEYSATVEASGGEEPYTWSISEGDLPDELELDEDTGVISGNATETGEFEFTVLVEDSSDPQESDTQELSISIYDELVITTTSLDGGTVGVSYNATIEATGGNGDYTWSISEGELPDGLELDEDTGVVSGDPTEAGDFDFTVRVEDSADPEQSDTQELSISISES